MKANKIAYPLLALMLVTVSICTLDAKEKYSIKPIPIPDGLSSQGVQSSIINAAIGRRWNIVSKKDNQIVINLTHRGYDSTLTFKIEKAQIKVSSDSWTTNKKGEKKKRKEPIGWIENIRRDIVVFMNRELYQ